ncbi:MAG: hypothetical protein K6L81_06135 [Agarilytica sp.]
MKYLLIILNTLFFVGCGGSGSTSNPSEVVDDPIGISRFEILNASSYAVAIDCETNGYDDCDRTEIEAGESLVLGEYGDIGAAPSPESVFMSVTVNYGPGDGVFVYSYELPNEQWSVSASDSDIVTYSTTVADVDLF